MEQDFLNAYLTASSASYEIYMYIERHGEWENEELMDSYNYLSKQAEHYNRALEVFCDEYERLV